MIGKVPFTDERFPFSELGQWKPKLPYGSVPTMTVDGAVYAQSAALLRYAGKLTGLYPADARDALKVDEACETCTDVLLATYRYMGDDAERKRVEREKFLAEDVPRYAGGLEKRLELFSDGPFVLGDEPSVADCYITTMVNNYKCGVVDYVPTGVLDEFPRIMAAYHATMALPEVVGWYKKHPITNVTET